MVFRLSGTCVLLLLVWAPAVYAQLPSRSSGSNPQSLDDLLTRVAQAHPSLDAATLRAEALALRTDQIPLWPDPQAGVTVMPQPIFTAKGAQRSQWRISQRLPYLGQRDTQIEYAEAEAAEAKAEVGVLRADLIIVAKEAYYALFLTQLHLADLGAFAEEVAQFEQAAAAQYEVGQGTQQAILMAQIERNRLTQRLIEQERRAARARLTLARLTDTPDLSIGRVDVHERPVFEAWSATALEQAAQANRDEWEVLNQKHAQSALQERLVDYEAKPVFSVNATYFDIADSDFPAAATGRDALGLGVNVGLSLQRGRLAAKRQEARVRQQQVDAQREAFATDVKTAIAMHLSELEQAQQQLDLYVGTLIPQATTTVEATLAAYTAGQIDFINLLDARRTLLSLHMDYHGTLIAYLITISALERTLGIDHLSDVMPLNYQPLVEP